MGGGDTVVGQAIQELTQDNVEFAVPETAMDDAAGGAVEADAPLIRLVNQIILDAYNMRASDIHMMCAGTSGPGSMMAISPRPMM
jgi:type II secretory ATPase GspE/PulE/Tfp pilus assembly ATPase PilB-like protein